MQGFANNTGYISIPITINSTTGETTNNTAQINFMVTSSMGYYTVFPEEHGTGSLPANALTYGNGSANYGFDTGAFLPESLPDYSKNVTQFLTIQASQGTGWAPPSSFLGYTCALANPSAGPPVGAPKFLNIAGLQYNNFSTLWHIY